MTHSLNGAGYGFIGFSSEDDDKVLSPTVREKDDVEREEQIHEIEHESNGDEREAEAGDTSREKTTRVEEEHDGLDVRDRNDADVVVSDSAAVRAVLAAGLVHHVQDSEIRVKTWSYTRSLKNMNGKMCEDDVYSLFLKTSLTKTTNRSPRVVNSCVSAVNSR